VLKNFLHTTQEFTKKNEPFAIAIVVRRDAPSSGKTGDKAVIPYRSVSSPTEKQLSNF
jgi:hypothetical protein